ncbi:hypothetical protein L1987_19193 [Smallanthus sonchifolius]|uniref:Uncharacterized protein n=1 Tax=Smallanthus sonchifolius TaxID=185202 RepID=A0ACB9IPZ0_9ASTR|nr:hypothetical protein L1987_19193 [Smallanthus sonchifolius]
MRIGYRLLWWIVVWNHKCSIGGCILCICRRLLNENAEVVMAYLLKLSRLTCSLNPSLMKSSNVIRICSH